MLFFALEVRCVLVRAGGDGGRLFGDHDREQIVDLAGANVARGIGEAGTGESRCEPALVDEASAERASASARSGRAAMADGAAGFFFRPPASGCEHQKYERIVS